MGPKTIGLCQYSGWKSFSRVLDNYLANCFFSIQLSYILIILGKETRTITSIDSERERYNKKSTMKQNGNTKL